MLSLVRDYLDTLFDRVKKEISVLRADIYLTQKSLSSPCDIEQEGGQMSEEIREVKDKG